MPRHLTFNNVLWVAFLFAIIRRVRFADHVGERNSTSRCLSLPRWNNLIAKEEIGSVVPRIARFLKIAYLTMIARSPICIVSSEALEQNKVWHIQVRLAELLSAVEKYPDCYTTKTQWHNGRSGASPT